MNGKAYLTCPAPGLRLDTVRVRVAGGSERAARLFAEKSGNIRRGYGFWNSEQFRFGRGKVGGLCFEFGAEVLRLKSYAESVQWLFSFLEAQAPGVRLRDCSLPRVDWAIQLDPDLRGEVFAHLTSNLGFRFSRTVTSELEGRALITTYFEKKSYFENLCDHFLVRIYDAFDSWNFRWVLRVELQERVCRRAVVSLLPTPLVQSVFSPFVALEVTEEVRRVPSATVKNSNLGTGTRLVRAFCAAVGEGIFSSGGSNEGCSCLLEVLDWLVPGVDALKEWPELAQHSDLLLAVSEVEKVVLRRFTRRCEES